MSTNTDLVNQFNALVTAFNTVIFGSDTQDVVLGNDTKPTISKIMRAYMENNGWTPFATEAELLASDGGSTVKGAYAFDTKKVYRWGLKVPSDPSQGWKWWDEGVSPLDLAVQKSKDVSNLRVESLAIGNRSNLITAYGYDSGSFLRTDGTTGANAEWAVTKNIPVMFGEVYRARTITSGNLLFSVCNIYSKDGTVIVSYAANGSTGSTNIRDISIPENASHMKLCFKISDIGTDRASLTLEKHSIYRELESIFDQPNLLDGVALTDGQYLSDNVATDNVYWAYTDYIAVEPNTSYVSSVRGASESTSTSVLVMGQGVHYYDANKALIKVGSRMLPNEPFETPPLCKFVRLNILKSTYSATTSTLVKGRSELNKSLIAAIKKELLASGVLSEVDILAYCPVTMGKYVNYEGVVSSSPNWSMTGQVPVKVGDDLTYYCEANSSISVISAYDANGVYIESLVNGIGSGTAINQGKYTITNPVIAFVVFSYYHVNGVQKFTKTALTNSSGGGGGGDAVPHRHNGKKWMCFGDSITDHYATAHTYPVYVSAFYKMILRDGAISGSRTRQSFNRTSQTSDSMISSSDFITIAHGTNDFKLETPLGTIDDIPTMRYADPADPDNTQYFANPDYANNSSTGGTFYADYMGLVEHCLKTNKNARMLLLTPLRRTQPSANGTDTNNQGHKLIDYVNAVKAIGEKYGIPVQDNYNQSGINAINIPTLLPDGLHPSQWTHENILASIVIGRFDLL